MVTIHGKYELEDLKAAQDLHARPGRWGMIGLYIVLLLLVFILGMGVVSVILASASWQVILLPLVILGFLALFWFVLRPYQIARVYRQHKELSSDFTMELNDEGYKIENTYGTGKIPWKDFAKWKAGDKIILLYRTDNMFNMVPRRLLQDETQAQYVLDQLQKNGVREASRVKNPVRLGLQWVLYILMAIVILLIMYMNLR